MNTLVLSALFLASLIAAPSNAAQTTAKATARSKNATVRLLSEVATFQPGKPFWVALHMKLAPKWHTYWKNPGDSGMPVRIVWTMPEVLRAGDLQFPAPIKAVDGGLALYGYEGEVTLLTEITPQTAIPPGDYTLSAKVSWLECLDICIPGKADLKISLKTTATAAAAPATNASSAPIFATARAALPKERPTFQFTVAEKSGNFVLMTSGTRSLALPLYFFPETAGLIEAAHDQTASRTALGWELSVKRPANASPIPPRLKGILVSGAGRSRQACSVVAETVARSPKH